ncbi:MAG: hypothetical protein ACRD1Q_13810, partial [Vicinamibacterales bacterium]
MEATRLLAAGVATLLVATSTPLLLAQHWTKVPLTSIPLTPDGKPDMFAPVPRTPDGKPDLSGKWSSKDNTFARNLATGLKEEDVPLQPWAKALFDKRKDGSHSREDPDANCLPQGVPKIGALAYPWRLIQTPGSIVIIYEAFTLWRQIFMDGRELIADPNPTWMGYSTAKWDGDTLVVDTRGFNGRLWLDQLGRPSTDALHVIERFHRRDFGHLDIHVTIDDPGAYTRPWSVKQEVALRHDTELMEFICNENNRDLEHLPGG